jgi:hypothetical protein
MAVTPRLVLLVLALVVFVIAAVGFNPRGSVAERGVPAGLAFLAAAFLFGPP